MSTDHRDIHDLVRRRWRMAVILSSIVVVMYFGFILLVAFAKNLAARQIIPGLSVGIVLGALVIVGAWLTTWFYVRWANRTIDAATARIAGGQ